MAITTETLRLVREQRVTVDREVDEAVRRLVAGWAAGWDQRLYWHWRDAAEALARADAWPRRGQIARNELTHAALATTDRELERLLGAALTDLTVRAERVAHATAFIQDRMVASQLPPSSSGLLPATAAVVLAGVGTAAGSAAMGVVAVAAAKRLASLLKPIRPSTMLHARQILVRGPGAAAAGDWRTASLDMLAALEGAFSAALARTLTTTRTDLYDAARAAAALAHEANRRHLVGWRWLSRLDVLTCPSCWARHGTLHRLDVPGPLDHPNGRCMRLPVLRSWRALGIAAKEPPSVLPDAEATFWSLAEALQLRIMGARRLALLRSGRIRWADLSVRRGGNGWRASYGMRPVRDLERIAAQRAAA